MKEKPILFNTEMVKAILEGRKTQTRRVIKDKDIINNFDIDVDGKPIAYIDQATGDSYKPTDLCRYQPDDILWVRETWAQICNDGEPPYYEYYADTGNRLPGEWPEEEKEYTLLRWRPSIHMPREAARIFPRVTNVKVERLQDITEEDVIAEGIKKHPIPNAFYEVKGYVYGDTCEDTAVKAFERLWNSINLKRGYGWDMNPWVWVVEFERLEVEKC